MSDSNLDVAIRIKEKFEAYLLGLIFTILALSIQTARFGASAASDLLELVSWSLLLLAGISGLSRMELVPELYRLFALQDGQEKLKQEARKAQLQRGSHLHVLETGESVSIVDYVARADDGIAKIKEAMKPHQRKVAIAYEIMRWSFVGGIVALIAARAIAPVRSLFGW